LLYEILKCNIDAIDISKTAIQVAQNRYDNINFIADDFLRTNQIKMNYDLIIVSQILWYVLENLDSFFQKMKNVASDKAKIIFIQTYYHPDKQEYGNNVMTKVDDIIDILPFQLENIIDVKNYKDGLWVETRSIIICNN
jgi:SAM-dependent methyltransferase